MDRDLENASGDFGGIIRRRPAAVLTAADIEQVRAAVRMADERGWRIAVQGRRHSTYGQAQVRGGLALSVAGLNHVRVDARARQADVGAGACWDEVIRQTLRYGLIPPVLTDYLGLSVGGTLSAGGIGGASFRAGSQADNVSELTVVTGAGQAVPCSARRHSDLFDAVRAGRGRFGVIVTARLRLEPAPAVVRAYKALYTDLAAMIADQVRLIGRPGITAIRGAAIPNAEPLISAQSVPSPRTQPWLYQMKITVPAGPGHLRPGAGDGPAGAGRLPLAGLSIAPAAWVAQECGAFEYADRMAPDVQLMKDRGLWHGPHPYLSVFLPARSALALIVEVLGDRPPREQGEGPVIISVLTRSKLRTPNLRLPSDDELVLLSLLPNVSRARVRAMLAANRAIYEAARRIGGTLYPIGSLPMTAGDWAAYDRPRQAQVDAAKRAYDPNDLFGLKGGRGSS